MPTNPSDLRVVVGEPGRLFGHPEVTDDVTVLVEDNRIYIGGANGPYGPRLTAAMARQVADYLIAAANEVEQISQ
jgi:hypothetical protein